MSTGTKLELQIIKDSTRYSQLIPLVTLHWRPWRERDLRSDAALEEALAGSADGVIHSDKLRVCFDTCHTSDSGYDIIHDFDGVIEKFDRLIGKDQIAVFHVNDSKNPSGAAKDRHANIGFGEVGFDALSISYITGFTDVKILGALYSFSDKKILPPYKARWRCFHHQTFYPDHADQIISANE